MSLAPETALHGRLGRGLARACTVSAAVGGGLMVAAMLALCLHVIGNAFGLPVLGISEIVEALIGMSIFCFLAPCHLSGANIVVDYFSRPLPQRLRDLADVVMTLLFALTAALLTWRMAAGGLAAFARHKQSMFLGLPEWPSYLVGSVACCLWVVVILHTGWSALRVFTGQDPRKEEAHGQG